MSDSPESSKANSLPALYARAKAWLGALSRPKKILLGTTIAAALLIGGYFSTRSAFEPYAVLFNGLEREDSAAVVAKLKELKVPYRLGGEGAAVEVPESRVHELRLELAGAGLPRGGAVGFESFDKLRLGATEFEQKVLYRRALEGELARTIGSLGAVQSARVHLVLPEKSIFVSRSEPATASIVVKLRAGRTLGPSEVGGIVHLTAASVPGLSADRIALVTADGAMLKRPKRAGAGGQDAADGASDEETASARSLELSLEDRVRQMLEKIVGQGHADVRVSAELDMARVERVEDHYDPAKTAVRSEEKSVERHDIEVPVAGVPGAESNLPGGSGGGKPAGGGQTIRESQTRNFEVDHVLEKRTTASGAVRRLTVAVVLDGVGHGTGAQHSVVPRPQDELDKLAVLVRGAVGADDKRGDVVTVHSMVFAEEAAPLSASVAPEPGKAGRDYARYAPYAVGGVLALVAAAVVLGKRRKKVDASKERATERLPAPAEAIPLPSHPEDVRTEVLDRVARDPATAALVIRGWLESGARADAGSLAS